MEKQVQSVRENRFCKNVEERGNFFEKTRERDRFGKNAEGRGTFLEREGGSYVRIVSIESFFFLENEDRVYVGMKILRNEER